ncbi:hypothetical protein PTH_2222 [Pelotomaculum thermopropionicum SI]|uniref:Uncharacterized protein n=1 Tax=Pelotomaculum thermopropionicum (strain DSM 13744 / JCM 10971 / SI) TaxID=370438 RepID=A5D019_PELTS|nr:hypothetical protein PTH_2222 [Pelotomaculum thermopropionicum SI]
MAGKIKRMIDDILSQVAKGDPVLIKTTKTKLILKGINPEKFTSTSEDDPAVMEKLSALAREFKVKLSV